MSALPIPNLPLPGLAAGRRHLRAVADRTARVSRLPFLLVLAGVLGVGLLGLVLLNTQLQDQAMEMRQLHREQARLTNREAYLTARIDEAGSPSVLAGKASALGMRANTHAVFLVVPDGTLMGEPRAVEGTELPSSVNAPAQRQAHQNNGGEPQPTGEQSDGQPPVPADGGEPAAQQSGEEQSGQEPSGQQDPGQEQSGQEQSGEDQAAAEQKAADEKKAAEEKAAADQRAAEQKAAEEKAAAEKKAAEDKAAAQQAKNNEEIERARRAASGEGG